MELVDKLLPKLTKVDLFIISVVLIFLTISTVLQGKINSDNFLLFLVFSMGAFFSLYYCLAKTTSKSFEWWIDLYVFSLLAVASIYSAFFWHEELLESDSILDKIMVVFPIWGMLEGMTMLAYIRFVKFRGFVHRFESGNYRISSLLLLGIAGVAVAFIYGFLFNYPWYMTLVFTTAIMKLVINSIPIKPENN